LISEKNLNSLIPSKRGAYDIFAQILSSIQDKPLKKSHISFKSELDSRTVTRYLLFMQHSNLIKKTIIDSTYYSITEKGYMYLEKYQALLRFIKS